MLRELRVPEMRYRAVLEVLDGGVISAVARRYEAVEASAGRCGGNSSGPSRPGKPHTSEWSLWPTVRPRSPSTQEDSSS